MRIATAILLPASVVLALMADNPTAFADEATEARLREALRNATEQLQELEQEKAAWQAQKAVVPPAPVQPAPDTVSRAAYERAVTRLNAQHAADAAQIAKLEAAQTAVAKQLGVKDADSTKAEASLADAQQRIKTLEDKNAKLVAIGEEILKRYENVDFSDVMGAREPFVGTKRVEIENIAQDYGDKIEDNKVEP